VQFRILGPVEVRDEKGVLPLGKGKQRALLALLLLHANEVVSSDRLIDELWGERPPESAANALQVYVSGLRKVLEPKRAAGEAEVLVTKAPGYLLKLEPESLDALCFERLARQGRSALAEGQLEEAAAALREALSLWRGDALVDFAFERFAQNEILRLDELRLSATEDRIEAELALGRGRHLQLVAELEGLVGEHPLRERLRAQLMLALYRAGRQADALELYRSTRRLFLDELGIEPSPALQRLEQSILRQEAALELALPTPDELFSQAPARKPVTAIVVDLETASASDARGDPEAGLGALAAWLETAAAVIERYGASVEELPDGALLGLFGVPVVREDDALRAALAVQEMRAALEEEASSATAPAGRLMLRIGIASGRALVGGGTGAAGIAGVVREATRLRQLARAGEALVGEATLALLGASIEVEQTPQGGWSLRGVAAEARAIPRQLNAPLVGRSAELGQLLELFEDTVQGGRVQIVSLLGAPGIGKTRLAQELGNRLGASAEALYGHCPSFGEGITFWPLAEIVRRLAGQDVQAGLESLLAPDQDAPLVAERLAGAIGAINRETPTEETFWAARRLFELLAARRPLLIVLDDLHWAEPTFLELVTHLAQSEGKEAPALIVCLARPELLASHTDWLGRRIELEPLDGEATDALLARLLAGASVAAHVRARIGEAAEGNPLFIEQMVAMLGGDGPEESEFAIPPTIEALLAARLDLLPADERRLVEAAAIAGREFSLDGVVALLADDDEEALDLALESLHRRQFLSPAGERRYRFRHELICDAGYEAIPKLTRSALHLRYADWLEQQAPAPPELEEIAAYHLERAFLFTREVDPRSESLEDLGERAASSLRAAGERAHARGDMPAAVSLLRRAQALPARSESERAQLLLALAGAQREVGDFEAADDASAEAIALASRLGNRALESQARILRLRMQLQTQVSLTLDELVRSAEQTIGELEVIGDEQGLGEAWSVLAWMSWLRCRAGPTAQSLERALVYAQGAGDETTIAQSMHLRIGAWLFGPTPVTEAIACCEQVLDRPHTQRRIEASAYRALAGLHAMLGRFEEARALLEQGRAIIDELGLRVAEAVAAEIGGMVELLAGDPAAAEERLRAGIAVLEPMGETSGVSTLTAMLAEACYQQGRPDEVLELSKLSARLAPDDDFSTQVQWRGPQAKVLAARGRSSEAEALASEAVSLAAESDFLNLRGNALLALAEVLHVGGRLAEARSAAEEARALFEQKGNVVSSAAAQRLLAELPLVWARALS
jgi:predicted ATPase/DNA-binding SARP family transcriptional activator